MSNEPRYPDLNEKSLGEQVAELKDYIVNLHRYIRYADNNIAERNLTRTLEDKINSYVDADGVIHILDELGFDSEVGFYNYVTFHNLQTEGETIINGDNITTGTILADYIDVDGIIAAKSIVVTDNLKDGSTIISGSNILTGTIDADLIRAGKILSTTNPNNFWDLDTGEFRLSPGNITVNQNNDTLSDYMDDTANDAVSAFENGTFATFVTDTNNSLDTKTTVYYESSSASIADPEEGDLWIDTDDNSLYRYNGATWDSVQDTDIAQALSDAADAQSTADSKIVTYAQASAPTDIPIGTLDVGDLWIDTDDNNKLYRWSGSAWTAYTDSSALNAFVTGAYATFVTNTNNSLSAKITTFYQSTAPTANVTGDLWIDTDDDNELYRWSGSAWVSVQDGGIQSALTAASNAQTTADGKIVTFAQASTPTADGIGDLWIDTDDSNKLYRWSGSAWVQYSDSSAANALDTSLDQAEVFKRLTNNGALQGIYMDNGNLYINGSYIKAGTIDTDYLDVGDIISTGSIIVAGADISNLNNDSGFITSGDIPEDLSDFNNDTGFITSSDIPDDLSDFNDDLGIVIETLPLYYRSTTQSTPSIDSSTSIGTSATTDDAWEYVMPRPKRGCYFYTCERFKKTDNSYTFSTVREIANASYTSLWCSNSDATYIDGGKIYANSVTADKINIKGLTVTDNNNETTLSIDNNGNFWTSGAVENSIDYVDATALSKPTKANLINAANGYYVLKDGKWVLASDNVDWVNDNYSSLTVDDISKANANLLTKTITVDDGKLLWETTDASNNVNKVIEFSGEDYTAQGGLSTFDIDFYNYTGLDSGNNPNNWNKAGSLYSLCPSVGSNHSIVLSSTGNLIIQGGNDPSNKVNIVSSDLRINNNTLKDFVVDEGTSNSWYYRIWYSGRMECWRRFSKTATAINTASGALYTTSGSTTFSNYPNNGFSAAPTVNMSLESDQGLMLAVTGTGTSSTPPSIKVMRTAAKTTSTTFYVDVYASGMKASS